jgi:hypothetical protein
LNPACSTFCRAASAFASTIAHGIPWAIVDILDEDTGQLAKTVFLFCLQDLAEDLARELADTS